MDFMPLRVNIDTTNDTQDVRIGAFDTITIPTLRETTATFAVLIDGVIAEYTFKAVGPVDFSHRPGELSEDDRRMLRETRRLINQLLDD